MKIVRRNAPAVVSLTMLATAAFAAEPEPLLEPDPCPDGDVVLAAQTPADEALQRSAQAALDAATLDRLTDVEAVAIGTTVCLRGRAANLTDYRRAEEIAASVRGVVQVENRLKVPLAE